MKVFGIGLNKTGTKTLGACFTTLGFRNKSYDLELLRDYSFDRTESIIHVAKKYDSFEDWPWPLLYKELDTHFIDAKFILTIRKSPEVWFESLCKHADRTGPKEARKIVYGHTMPHNYQYHHISYYNKHIDNVQRYFANREDKLIILCWENGDKWDKISSFLGMPEPDIPFPHLNNSLNKPNNRVK